MTNENPSPNSASTGFYIGIGILGCIGAIGLFMVIYAVGITLRDRFTTAPTIVANVSTATQVNILPTNVVAQQPTTASQPTATKPQPTNPPAATQGSSFAGPTVKVLGGGALFRSGPGTEYEVLGSMAANEQYPIIGRTQDGQWLALQYNQTRVVWLFISLVEIQNGTVGGIPVRNTPQPPATATPIPPTPIPATLTPAFTATAAVPVASMSRGVRGDSFSVRSTSVGVNNDIWFDFKVTNTTNQTLPFGGLGAVALNKQGKPSFGRPDVFGPNQVYIHSDHINISTPGTYSIHLGICWDESRTACEQSGSTSTWALLSSGYTVVVK